MRRLSLCLATSLFATTALAGGLGDMSEEERAAFHAEVRQYLIDHPEVIVEAMNVLQGREDAAAAERDLTMLRDNNAAIFENANDWAGGNPEGDITVVEFMDYRCGYCRKAHDEVAELISSDGNIRYVIKEFPILGEQSVLSSQFAIAIRLIHGDDAYKAAHNALITLRGDATIETLSRLATDLGHDAGPIIERMKSPEVNAVIEANHALASTMEINGTPTFVVDKAMVRGYVPLEGMRKIVAGQRDG
ncbi:MAG: DsbA family protein [Tabrizicola sp.]|nr:DsbA family protein [Tabrizicola sp.]